MTGLQVIILSTMVGITGCTVNARYYGDADPSAGGVHPLSVPGYGGLTGQCPQCEDDCQPRPGLIETGYKSIKDSFITGHTARKCASKAIKCLGLKDASSDFRNGFIQAYEDVADGQSGATPPVPPSKYWTAYYRSAAGKHRAQLWFDGYRTGAASALDKRFTYYGPVADAGIPYSEEPVPRIDLPLRGDDRHPAITGTDRNDRESRVESTYARDDSRSGPVTPPVSATHIQPRAPSRRNHQSAAAVTRRPEIDKKSVLLRENERIASRSGGVIQERSTEFNRGDLRRQSLSVESLPDQQIMLSPYNTYRNLNR